MHETISKDMLQDRKLYRLRDVKSNRGGTDTLQTIHRDYGMCVVLSSALLCVEKKPRSKSTRKKGLTGNQT